ncbi:hypothetical protein L6R52_30225 [Myxococcota bacterium]|nr:hypothetical protein [Myxococcota bacterium]
MSAQVQAGLHDDVATLLASMSLSPERAAFLEHVVRAFLAASRSLSVEDRDRRVVELLALASRLLSDRPGSSEVAARQLRALCVCLVGEPKGARELSPVGPEPASRSRSPSHAPTLDAATPLGALTLSSVVAALPALGAPPRELRAGLGAPRQTDPPVGAAKGAPLRASGPRDVAPMRSWTRGSAEARGRAK